MHERARPDLWEPQGSNSLGPPGPLPLLTKEDLADLYLKRWSIELDLRSIKIVMQMDVLRCNSPEMVDKEI
jgi:hypothetical protein